MDSYDVERIIERINELERQQMLANSRIRQDTTNLGASVLVIGLTTLAIWDGVPFRWWYAFVALPIWAIWSGRLISKVQDREEPAWPKLKE